MELLTKSLDFTLRKRKWAILMAICGYGMYKLYNLPCVSRKRERIVKLLRALISIAEIVSDSAETVGVVSTDLKEYLASSDEGQVPNSLKQVSKILVSDEWFSGVFKAATVGVIQGSLGEDSSRARVVAEASFSDDVIDKLTSKAGSGFVSVVVGSFARNLVLGYEDSSSSSSSSGLTIESSNWVDVLSREKSRLVMGDFIETFVSTAVAVYLDRGTSINLDDGNGNDDSILCELTRNPKQQKQVQDIVVYVCSGAVETLIKTSHQLLTATRQPSATAFC